MVNKVTDIFQSMMKSLFMSAVCILPMYLGGVHAEPVQLEDVSDAPLWFAHVDMNHLKLEDGNEVVADSGCVRQVVKLRELLKDSLSIQLEDIRGITILGTDFSGRETCFLLKGQMDEVKMGKVVETLSISVGDKKPVYSLHQGPRWLGEGWYLSQVRRGEIVAANSTNALKKVLIKRQKNTNAVSGGWKMDDKMKRQMATAGVVIAFNMEAIHRELGLESSLSGLLRTVCFLATPNGGKEVTSKLILQAKSADAMKVVQPEINVLIALLRAYEEGAQANAAGGSDEQKGCWGKAELVFDATQLSISMKGKPDEMIRSFQKLEKLLPKQGE